MLGLFRILPPPAFCSRRWCLGKWEWRGSVGASVWGKRASLILLMEPVLFSGLPMTPTEGTPSLKCTTDAILPLSSRVQEEASGSPPYHIWVKEDFRELNTGHFTLVGPLHQSPPSVQPSPLPQEALRPNSSHLLPLPSSPCVFSPKNPSEKEEAFPFSLSVLNGLPLYHILLPATLSPVAQPKWKKRCPLYIIEKAQTYLICASGPVLDVFTEANRVEKILLIFSRTSCSKLSCCLCQRSGYSGLHISCPLTLSIRPSQSQSWGRWVPPEQYGVCTKGRAR